MLLIQWLHYFSLFFKNGLSSKWVREILTIYRNFLLQVVTTWKGWTTMEVLNTKDFLPFTFHLRTSTLFLTFYIPFFISHIFSHPRTCKNHTHILNMGMIKKLQFSVFRWRNNATQTLLKEPIWDCRSQVTSLGKFIIFLHVRRVRLPRANLCYNMIALFSR